MTGRACTLNPKVMCDGDEVCQCVPPEWPGSPEEWREMTLEERQAVYDGAADVLLDAILTVFGKQKLKGQRP